MCHPQKEGSPPRLGKFVLTANRPDPPRAAGAKLLAGLLRRGPPICLFFGFGPRGPHARAAFPPRGNSFPPPGGGGGPGTGAANGGAPGRDWGWVPSRGARGTG